MQGYAAGEGTVRSTRKGGREKGETRRLPWEENAARRRTKASRGETRVPGMGATSSKIVEKRPSNLFIYSKTLQENELGVRTQTEAPKRKKGKVDFRGYGQIKQRFNIEGRRV